MAQQWIIGIDEVGRGPLAGPVCVCAVAMPVHAYVKIKTWKLGAVRLTDSKKMTAPARELWAREAQALKKAEKIHIGISLRSAAMIDRCGISACISSCVAGAIRQLTLDPKQCIVLLDGGLRAPASYKNQTTVIRGDSAHPIISLASVVAKVRRDKLMKKLHDSYSRYAWSENKGYGTLKHRQAIRRHGPTPIHRKSFISKVI